MRWSTTILRGRRRRDAESGNAATSMCGFNAGKDAATKTSPEADNMWHGLDNMTMQIVPRAMPREMTNARQCLSRMIPGWPTAEGWWDLHLSVRVAPVLKIIMKGRSRVLSGNVDQARCLCIEAAPTTSVTGETCAQYMTMNLLADVLSYLYVSTGPEVGPTCRQSNNFDKNCPK